MTTRPQHREERHPAADLPPVPGRVLWRATRDNGDEVTLTGHCLPRPHVRLEVRRGDEVRSVALALSELPDLVYALLRAPRVLAAAARRLA